MSTNGVTGAAFGLKNGRLSRLLAAAAIGMAAAAIGIPISPADLLTQEHPSARSPEDLAGVREYLETAERQAGFSGVVLIGRGDNVVYQEAFGFADAEHQVRMRTEHLLRIGSLTKPITASAVVAAVDRGLFALEAHVCDFIPSCLASWRDVTIAHLLTHSSGIPDHFGDLESVPVRATTDELRRVLDALPPDEPLLSAPGAEYAYSNFNYVLLGAALEAVMGVTWEAALNELVFEPLGLETIAYDDVFAIVPDRARGYERDDDLGLRNTEYDDHAAYAAGGLLANAVEVFRWTRGMLTAKLFGPELVEQSLTPYKGNYGYGWQVRRFFDRRIYNHTGGIEGFSSHLAHYPDEGITIVVLSNVENDSAILRACDLASLLFEWRPATELTDADLTPRQRCGIE